MNRRDLFGTAAAAAGAAALLAPEAAPEAAAHRPRLDPALPNYVRTQDNVALFYRDWGQGKPVLFIHGWGAPSDIWSYQMPALSRQGLRCIAYDRRGHGRSSDPGGGYDYDTLSDDLAAVIEALDLHGVTLVGHSMASGEMVRYLTRHGASRIAKLVFLAPAATPYPLKTADNPAGVDGAFFEHFRNDILTHDLPGWLDQNAAPFFTPETSPGLLQWVKSLMYQTTMQALIECNRCGTTTDFRAELPKITVPSVIIQGDRDASATLDQTGRPTAALIPGARLIVYEGAPHGLMLTHVDRLNGDLVQFVGA